MTDRRICHADLDAFFVSVERTQDPSLVGKPVIVGGDPNGRGVVSCASYEARAYGVRAGTPLVQASRLCPHAVFLRGRWDLYAEVSGRFMAILKERSPFVQVLGVDEAYVDLTGFERLYGPPSGVARQIKERVRQELGITVSIGIASSRVTAKVASDYCKPDGLLEIPPGGDAAFLAPLPVAKLPGVGPKTSTDLWRLDIKTVGDLARASPSLLRRVFGVRGDALLHWANGGDDDGEFEPPGAPKSISRETTFPRDTRDREFLRAALRRLAERVGADLRSQGMTARQVSLKLRWADFTTLTRQLTLRHPTDTDDAVLAAGIDLLGRELAHDGRHVRLIGIGVGELSLRSQQLSLWETSDEREHRLATALDEIRSRFGVDSVHKGAVVQGNAPTRYRPFRGAVGETGEGDR